MREASKSWILGTVILEIFVLFVNFLEFTKI